MTHAIPTALPLNADTLFAAACEFADQQSELNHTNLFGISDGKAVGTYIEHRFERFLQDLYPDIEIGSSANGLDLPDPRLNCDLKVTRIQQPQSSCPYRRADQKIYGLGYNLLVFVYDKTDDIDHDTCILDFRAVTYINAEHTGDFTTTRALRRMLADDANRDDLIGYMLDRNLPADDITLNEIADRLEQEMPEQGYLTISNALQWRLQYRRAINLNNTIAGVRNYGRI